MELLDSDSNNDQGNALYINVLASSFTMFKIGKYSKRQKLNILYRPITISKESSGTTWFFFLKATTVQLTE